MTSRLWKNFDWLLLALAIVLTGFGMVMIASATQFRWEDPSTWSFVTRAAMWFALGLAVLATVVTIDYHVFSRLFRILYVVNIGMLAAVLLVGKSSLGAKRWIDVGPLQFQPSEVAKIVLILTLAHVLAKYEGELRRPFDALIALLYVVPPMLLVVLQPDLGTAIVFVVIALVMVYAAGFSGWLLTGGVALGLIAGIGWIVAHLRWGIWIPLERFQLTRLLVFLDPSQDPFDAGYNIIQSRIAIGSGKLYGQGLFEGAQNQLNYLPEQQTDFIFAVVGEELGFIGGASLIFLLCALMVRATALAGRARDTYGALIIAGCVAMIGFQVLVNIGMTMGIMPVTGVPLPFISYGGTALLTNYAAIGLIINVHMRRRQSIFA